jgi:threonine aldolase
MGFPAAYYLDCIEETPTHVTDIPFASNNRMFGSDNLAGAHPRIVEAVMRYSGGFALSYGDDELTKRVERRIAELFEHECAVFLVATGTAANALALGTLCPPYGAIYCHPLAHINTDECGAPEFYTGGAKLVTIEGASGKITAAGLAARLEGATVHGIHSVKPSVVTLTNASELGTIYKPAELAAIAEIAQAHGMKFQVDGARFANAVAALNLSPAEMTWKSGVDVLCFGATKVGAIAAEAVIFFNPALAGEFEYRRKRGGQLWSKHRFLAAQFDAFLEDDLWLKNASHANAMAKRLAEGLAGLPNVSLTQPVEANELFPALPEVMIAGLQADGFVFYRWSGATIRLVTSFATTIDDVDAFLASARKHAGVAERPAGEV